MRVARIIRMEFGVSCHPAQVGRILKHCEFSLQKPVRRTSQRNEDVIWEWRERRFGQLKKALAEGRAILWADESGSCLLPALLRTWAPAGKTPAIRHKLSCGQFERHQCCQHDWRTVPGSARTFLQGARCNQVPGAVA